MMPPRGLRSSGSALPSRPWSAAHERLRLGRITHLSTLGHALATQVRPIFSLHISSYRRHFPTETHTICASLPQIGHTSPLPRRTACGPLGALERVFPSVQARQQPVALGLQGRRPGGQQRWPERLRAVQPLFVQRVGVGGGLEAFVGPALLVDLPSARAGIVSVEQARTTTCAPTRTALMCMPTPALGRGTKRRGNVCAATSCGRRCAVSACRCFPRATWFSR